MMIWFLRHRAVNISLTSELPDSEETGSGIDPGQQTDVQEDPQKLYITLQAILQ